MSALGHKRTLDSGSGMSALPPKADMFSVEVDVCFVPTGDIDATNGARGVTGCRRRWHQQRQRDLGQFHLAFVSAACQLLVECNYRRHWRLRICRYHRFLGVRTLLPILVYLVATF